MEPETDTLTIRQVTHHGTATGTGPLTTDQLIAVLKAYVPVGAQVTEIRRHTGTNTTNWTIDWTGP